MNLSQPAVSRLLKDLEEDTELRLFDRSKGRLLPTPEASLLLEEVQRSFVGLDRIASIAAEIRKGQRGTIAISSMPTLASTLIPKAISQFVQQVPGVRITLDSVSSLFATQQVLTGASDLGFISTAVPTPGLHFERKYEIVCRCILPAKHRLAKLDVIRPADLDGEVFVGLSNTTHTGTQIELALDRYGTNKHTRIETPLAPLASLIVLAGGGVGIVDAVSADNHERLGGKSRPFEPTIKLVMGIVRRENTPLSNLQTKFVELFDASIAPFERLNRQ
jgi:DNA-binding transcriptional LysR family regulator